MPALKNRYRKDKRHVLSFSWDTEGDPKRRFKKEIAYFEKNVSELLETLIELMGRTDSILIIYHPYLQHLQAPTNSQKWNNIVSSTLSKIC